MTARFADVLEISLAMSVVLAVLLALRPLLKSGCELGPFTGCGCWPPSACASPST